MGLILKKQLWILMVFLLLLQQNLWCSGCTKNERIALLNLAAHFNHYMSEYWKNSRDCCDWDFVWCDSVTRKRVTELHLSYRRDEEVGDWYLNTSFFLPFKQLNYLSLFGNNISGCVENEGFERLSSLSNLESLYLDDNQFNNIILPSLNAISSLKYLSLENNRLKGTINIQELSNLTSLEKLYLYGNEIEGFKSSQGLSNLFSLYLGGNHITNNLLSSLRGFSSLKYLDLSYNSLQGTFDMKEIESMSNLEEIDLSGNKIIKFQASRGLANFKNLEILHLNDSRISNEVFQVISKIPSLKTLSMRSCELNDTISGLCELKHLQVLDLSYNNLTGALPWCLANMTSLQYLDLSSNHFTGDIFPLQTLQSITDLGLSQNHFRIPFSLTPFFNHTKLNFFDGSGNEVYLETKIPNLIPKFQLQYLDLSRLNFSGAFPKFLSYQHNLEEVYLSNNKIEGGFPFWLLDNNTKLEIVYLHNNSLSGPFQLPIRSHMSLEYLDISNNGLHGQIPGDIGMIFPELQYLQISRNYLSGRIPNSLFNCSLLEFLDLSDNYLSGTIPKWTGNASSLRILDLSTNNISGNLPSDFNHPKLSHIFLSENRIQGPISNAFYRCLELQILDLRHNLLNGTIPKWIGNRLSSLSHLSLSHNNLEGEIPVQFCHLDTLQLIDLSHNNLSGRIPHCLKLTRSYAGFDEYEQPTFDFTTKWVTYTFDPYILSILCGIDFSANKLIGEIPLEIGSVGMMNALNLSHNNLTGHIPSTLSNLSQIESLDLSYNNLNGKIPTQLTQLNSLGTFSVAHNNLSGKIPDFVAQFGTFDNGSYEGNPFLCGPPLSRPCTTPLPPPFMQGDSTDEEQEENGFIDMEDFLVSFLIGFLTVLLTIAAVLWINPRWRRAWFWRNEASINNCQYFLEDNVYVLFKFQLPAIFKCFFA